MAEVKQRNSVPVKEQTLNSNLLLDNTYIEYAIFGLFRIDLSNYIKVKSVLAKEFHIQPSEIDKMPAWEYELFLKEINLLVKEENDRNKKEMDKSGYDNAHKMSDPKYVQNMQKQYMRQTKVPTDFKMPKI